MQWILVKEIPASKGNAVHRVEESEDGAVLRCSCQSYKIRKNTDCKHIIAIMKERFSNDQT